MTRCVIWPLQSGRWMAVDESLVGCQHRVFVDHLLQGVTRLSVRHQSLYRPHLRAHRRILVLYWSSSTGAFNPTLAWFVNFGSGNGRPSPSTLTSTSCVPFRHIKAKALIGSSESPVKSFRGFCDRRVSHVSFLLIDHLLLNVIRITIGVNGDDAHCRQAPLSYQTTQTWHTEGSPRYHGERSGSRLRRGIRETATSLCSCS